MIYLLDANVLIDANRDYYAIERVPEFWDWLEHMASSGAVKVPAEILDEIKEGNDDLAAWCKSDSVAKAILLGEDVDLTLVQRVVAEGYAEDLTDVELVAVGRDPFLVAYAMIDPAQRVVVTTEAPRPRRQRANRHLPDVCADLGVASIHAFRMIKDLDFRTSWRP